MPTRRVTVKVQVAVNQSTLETKAIEKRCWTWSIYPLFFLAQLVGVDLVQTHLTATSRHRQKWIKFVRVFCILLNFVIYVGSIILLYYQLDELALYFSVEGEIVTKTYLWNMSIDGFSFFMGGFGCHLILIMVIRNQWPCLVNAFRKSEPLLDDKFFLRLRHLSLIGVAYIFVEVGGAGMVGVIQRLYKKSSLQIKLMSFLSVLLQIYPFLTLVITSIAFYASSANFQSIAMQLKRWHEQYHSNEYPSSANLRTLKAYYVIACRTVDSVQKCFGWSLLMIISYHFVTVINSAFFMFGKSKQYPSISEIVFFSFYIFNLFLISSSAECVRVQSDNILKVLLRMQIKPADIINRKQVTEFVWLVALCPQRVSALGFFTIGKKLIPTMIGTTLTYYVILHQFHLSESRVLTQ